MSAAISSFFNSVGTEANKAKLNTEIAMKQHQIKGIKQEFGVAAWDLAARDDTDGLIALFKQKQAISANVIGDLAKLQQQLVALGGTAPTHIVSVTLPADAKEGEVIEAEASDGSRVKITVPAGSAPGSVLNVRVPVPLPAPVAVVGKPVVATTAEPVTVVAEKVDPAK